MRRKRPTQQRLHELFHYDPLTGNLTRRVTVSYNAKAGSVAGTEDANGYLMVSVDGVSYAAHRLAISYMTGRWPEKGQDIDHKNGIGSDNRWENLRVVPHSWNIQNQRRASRNSSSGIRGVRKLGGRWVAHIKVNGRAVYLGSFQTSDEARDAYVRAKVANHPGFILQAA